jgi:hypothetical protein
MYQPPFFLRTLVSHLPSKEGGFEVNFLSKITPLNYFSFFFIQISDFQIYLVFYLWVCCRLSATLWMSSSWCGVIWFFRLGVVFVRFRLKNYIRLDAYSINDSGVVNVVDSMTWVFRALKFHHICRHCHICRHFAVVCY